MIAVVVGEEADLGRRLAVELARRGHDVALVGHSADELEATAAEIVVLGRRAATWAAIDGARLAEGAGWIEQVLGAPALLCLLGTGESAFRDAHPWENVPRVEGSCGDSLAILIERAESSFGSG